MSDVGFDKYSKFSITRTHTGNPFELWKGRIMESNYKETLSEGTEESVMEVSNYRDNRINLLSANVEYSPNDHDVTMM